MRGKKIWNNMTKKYVLKAESKKIKISPFGFHKYASDYLETADKWLNQSSYSPVPYFLYCRAIELGLKAYLLAKGENLDFVKKKIGHNLTKGLKYAINNSLDEVFETTFIEKEEIELANKYYKNKGFEYFFVEKYVTGREKLPKLDILNNFSRKLIDKIKPLVDNTDLD